MKPLRIKLLHFWPVGFALESGCTRVHRVARNAALSGALLFGCGVARPALAAPLAILTDVSGGVQIVRGANKMAGKSGTKLEAGDVVRVAKGAATIYYVTRPPQMVKANQQVKVAPAGGAVGKPSLWRNVYSGIASGFARRAQNTPGVVRAGVPPVRPMWPVNSTLLQTQPTFYWSHNEAKPAFHLVIKDAQDNLVWEGTSTVAKLEYPGTAPLLKPGQKYFWEVQQSSLDDNGQVKPLAAETFMSAKNRNATFFRIGSAEDVRAAQQEMESLHAAMFQAPDAQRRFTMAAALDRRGFYNEAIALLVPEILSPSAVATGNMEGALKSVVPHLDESTRSLLRGLWYATGQKEFVKKILKQPIEFVPKIKQAKQ